jgi:putative addiction module component (TIGR02574 family)
MTPHATNLFNEALHLPEGERSELAARLIESLDPTRDDDAKAAWSAEIQQRIAELQTGQVQPIPWSEARRMILDDTDDSVST